MSSKKPSDHYIALGVTAFCVIGASILFFFLLYHFTGVWALVEKLMLILRPILYGLVLAFLLLPVQRHILAFLTSLAPSPKVRPILNGTAILLSLMFALLVIYILLAMVLPQLYFSVVGLVQAFPDYIETVQNWLVKTWEDNPALREFLLPYYESTTQALEDWLENDIMPNLESMSTVLNWAKEFLLPNVTDVVTSVSVVVATSLMVLKDILIGLIVSVYLLARKDTFAAQSKKNHLQPSPHPVRRPGGRGSPQCVPHHERLHQRQAGRFRNHRRDLSDLLQYPPLPLPSPGGNDHRRDKHCPVFRAVHWRDPLLFPDSAGESAPSGVFCAVCAGAPAI